MITREQVTTIIAKALAPNWQQEDTLGRDAFATRLATALDALGLIQFCDIAEPEQLNPQVGSLPDPSTQPQHPTPGSEFSERRDRTVRFPDGDRRDDQRIGSLPPPPDPATAAQHAAERASLDIRNRSADR